MTPGAWVRRLALAVAVLSGLAALSVEMLPLLLVLLLLLFDRVTHGVLVLLGALLEWLRSLLPAGGGGLSQYGALAADPLAVAARALLLGLPCLAGLLLLGIRRWRPALLCWGLDLALAVVSMNLPAAIALFPGLLAILTLIQRS